MTLPIRSSAAAVRRPDSPAPTRPAPSRPTEAGSASEPSAFQVALRSAAQSLGEGERFVAGAMHPRRGVSDPAALLALQAGVYRYTQEVELASKLVDKATGGIKQVLQSQQ